MRGPTQNVVPIGSAVLIFIGYKKTSNGYFYIQWVKLQEDIIHFHKIEKKNVRSLNNNLQYCEIGRRPLDQNYDFKVQ